eukprot:TRINITY_DN63637_c0_g1_i1.p1 TRINITY_DN63637_c0_g1~~TRINITY_DN63637_c0_g1_i1.p1  ORF type:complete len:981 (-),score=217.58 TRINITY_DN63637_c0_g1_i1:120-2990(-)
MPCSCPSPEAARWLLPCALTALAAVALALRRFCRGSASEAGWRLEERWISRAVLFVENFQLWGVAVAATLECDAQVASALGLEGAASDGFGAALSDILVAGAHLGLSVPLCACGTQAHAGFSLTCGLLQPGILALVFGTLCAVGGAIEVIRRSLRPRRPQASPASDTDTINSILSEITLCDGSVAAPSAAPPPPAAGGIWRTWAVDFAALVLILLRASYASLSWSTLRAIGCASRLLGAPAASAASSASSSALFLCDETPLSAAAVAVPVNLVLLLLVLLRASGAHDEGAIITGSSPMALARRCIPRGPWAQRGQLSCALTIIIFESSAWTAASAARAGASPEMVAALWRCGYFAAEIVILCEVLQHFRRRWLPREPLQEVHITLRVVLLAAFHGLMIAPRGDARFACAVEAAAVGSVAGGALLSQLIKLARARWKQQEGLGSELAHAVERDVRASMQRRGRTKVIGQTMQNFGDMALQVVTGDARSLKMFYANMTKDEHEAVQTLASIIKRNLVSSKFVSFTTQVSTQWAFAIAAENENDDNDWCSAPVDAGTHSHSSSASSIARHNGALLRMTPHFAQYNSLDEILSKPPPMKRAGDSLKGRSSGSIIVDPPPKAPKPSGSDGGRAGVAADGPRWKSYSEIVVDRSSLIGELSINSKSAAEVLRMGTGPGGPQIAAGSIFDPSQLVLPPPAATSGSSVEKKKSQKGTPARTSGPKADLREDNKSTTGSGTSEESKGQTWLAKEGMLSQVLFNRYSSGATEDPSPRAEPAQLNRQRSNDSLSSSGVSISAPGEDMPTSRLIHEAMRCLGQQNNDWSDSESETGLRRPSATTDEHTQRAPGNGETESASASDRESEAWNQWRARRARKKQSSMSRSTRNTLANAFAYRNNDRAQSPASSYCSYKSAQSSASRRSNSNFGSGIYVLPQQFCQQGSRDLSHHGGDSEDDVEEAVRSWG